jgi:hypothetical protein
MLEKEIIILNASFQSSSKKVTFNENVRRSATETTKETVNMNEDWNDIFENYYYGNVRSLYDSMVLL